MKKRADAIYREMLLTDARKSRHPRLATWAVKCFWWLSDDCVFAWVAGTILTLSAVGLTALGVMFCHVLWETWL